MTNVNDKKGVKSINETEYPSSDEGDLMEPPPYNELPKMRGKTLAFDWPGFPWRDVVIQDMNSNSPEYFSDISVYSRNTPDVVLHAQAKGGPIVGQARFRWSRSITCGVGVNELSAEWSEMKRSGVSDQTFQFVQAGRLYTFSKTREGGLKSLLSHFQVIDEATGEVIAYYASRSAPGRRRGVLTFKEGVSRDLEILIILAIISVREKRRRRSAATAGAGSAAAAG